LSDGAATIFRSAAAKVVSTHENFSRYVARFGPETGDFRDISATGYGKRRQEPRTTLLRQEPIRYLNRTNFFRGRRD
jgi:hypothetical protein